MDVWIKVALLPSRGLNVTPTVSVLWLRWEAGSPNLGGVSQRYDKGRIPKYLIPPLGMLNSNSGKESDTWEGVSQEALSSVKLLGLKGRPCLGSCKSGGGRARASVIND